MTGSSCVDSTAAGAHHSGAPSSRPRGCNATRPAAKRTVARTLWGPYETRYLLDCGHWVTGKTRATVPAAMECNQCDE